MTHSVSRSSPRANSATASPPMFYPETPDGRTTGGTTEAGELNMDDPKTYPVMLPPALIRGMAQRVILTSE